jgi:hypothetical protein
MKMQLNEIKRMQQLAGIVKENIEELPTTEEDYLEGKDQYTIDVIDNLKLLSKKLGLTLEDDYLDQYSQKEDFKDMVEVEKMNRKTPAQAAKSIISIWR